MRGQILRYSSSLVPFWITSTAISPYRTMSASAYQPALAALAQLQSTSDKYKNLKDIAHCAHEAKRQGASMLFLPECFGFLGESSQQTLENAEPIGYDITPPSNHPQVTLSLETIVQQGGIDGHGSTNEEFGSISLMDGLQTIAKTSGLWISGGGIHESGAPEDPETQQPRVYNTHVILDKEGTLKALYRKIHLFDVSIPGKVQLRESATTAPGTELVVCHTPIGELGLTTCYDVRFPETYSCLLGLGAQVMLVPSAFTVPTGAAHWHTLLRARAIENQCFVLAAAQYGRHNVKRESFGHSLAVDPWGKVLVDAGGYPCESSENEPQETPSVSIVEINLEEVDSVRTKMPIVEHRNQAMIDTFTKK
eukprot:Nitzschia sp. Nitz4//scaffold162_size51285//4532//5810//NITZ4_006963-RA/size51285-augustus-gene-0.28-mRNA-1//-1//CDS//3329537955//3116//frame0